MERISLVFHGGPDACPKEKKKKKTTQAVKTLPTSIKQKGIPRAKAPCNPLLA